MATAAMATEGTDNKPLLNDGKDLIVINRKSCKIITILAVLFVILNIICIIVLFSMVIDDDNDGKCCAQQVINFNKSVVNTSYALPIGSYSTAIEAHNLIFISGQLGLKNDSSELVSDDVADQTTVILRNMRGMLSDAGSNMDKVVKCTVLLANISDFGIVNGIYSSFFNVPYPARAAFAVRDLPLGAKVEIEAIALI